MKRIFLTISAIFLLAPLMCAAKDRRAAALDESHYSISKLEYLLPGRYKCLVSGILCNACTRAIVEGLQKIKGIKHAQFDFEDGRLWLTIDKGKKVKPHSVIRALHHAERRVNLGTRFYITDIRFVP